MGVTEFSVSRRKTAPYLGGSLAFLAIDLLLLQHPDEDAWKLQLGLGFFGLCALVFVWLLIRPQRLLLDRQGFTVLGGFIRSPKKIPWRDVEAFFVYRLPKGGKMIGYNYRPGARKDSALARVGRAFGADGALPKGWALSPENMVVELNAYRQQALGAGGATSPMPEVVRFPTVSR
jgi:hypothetical protein